MTTPVEPDEELIPQSNLPKFAMKPWILAFSGFTLAFAGLGIASQRLGEGAFDAHAMMLSVYAALFFNVVFAVVPVLGALALIWAAFASPGWSDRLLWTAAMILTTNELAPLASLAFRRSTSFGALHSYPIPHAAVGIVAYCGCLLVVDRSALPAGRKQILGLSCLAAILLVVVFPAVDPYIRFVDVAGSFLFAGAMLALGVIVADAVVVNLFRREEGQPAAAS